MRSVKSSSIAPEPDDVVHLVLDDFGPIGQAYRETEPAEAGERIIIENLLSGGYSRPRSIVAFSLSQGWVRDVTAEVARKVVARSRGGADIAMGDPGYDRAGAGGGCAGGGEGLECCDWQDGLRRLRGAVPPESCRDAASQRVAATRTRGSPHVG
jgi:hypothetical protein